MPKVMETSAEMKAWQETHLCPICNGVIERITHEEVDTYITLRPQYRFLARFAIPPEPWQSENIGGEWLMEVECENGHVMSGRHVVLR